MSIEVIALKREIAIKSLSEKFSYDEDRATVRFDRDIHQIETASIPTFELAPAYDLELPDWTIG